MKKLTATFFLLVSCIFVSAQQKLRTVEELITRSDPGWPFVQQMVDSAKNIVEVLPVDTTKTREALYHTQVTTRTPMGAIIYTSGGILVDGGWIRILGSGHPKLNRTVPAWNKGKSFTNYGEKPSYLLVADDAVGGFFAINGGQFGKDLGQVYYLSPDRLVWEALNLSYTDFLNFCFSGELDKFYGSLRWTNWRKDVAKLNGNSVYNFSPYLWSKEGKDINRNKRRKIPVEKQFDFNMESRRKLGLDKTSVQ